MTSDVRVVFITAPSKDTAATIAHALVEERLAACVNILPQIRSIYRWEGTICDESETLLVVKTTAARLDALKMRLPALHPYSVPECIALSVDDGLTPYLDWVDKQTTPE